MSEQSDHDILITIKNDVEWIKDGFIKHCEENAIEISDLRKTTEKAHQRIDWMFISGVLAIISLAFSIFFKGGV